MNKYQIEIFEDNAKAATPQLLTVLINMLNAINTGHELQSMNDWQTVKTITTAIDLYCRAKNKLQILQVTLEDINKH